MPFASDVTHQMDSRLKNHSPFGWHDWPGYAPPSPQCEWQPQYLPVPVIPQRGPSTLRPGSTVQVSGDKTSAESGSRTTKT